MNYWSAGGRQWAAGQRTSCRYPIMAQHFFHSFAFPRAPHGCAVPPVPSDTETVLGTRWKASVSRLLTELHLPMEWLGATLRGAVRGSSPRIGRVPRGRGVSRGGGALPHNVKPPPLAPLVLSPRERTHNSFVKLQENSRVANKIALYNLIFHQAQGISPLRRRPGLSDRPGPSDANGFIGLSARPHTAPLT